MFKLSYVMDKNIQDINKLLLLASAEGNIHIVKYICDNCRELQYDTAFVECVINGHLELVKYFYEMCQNQLFGNIFICFSYAVIVAIEHRKLDIINYFCTKRIYPGAMSLLIGAKHGNLDYVKYCYTYANDITIEFNTRAYICSAEKGHLDVVIFLKSKILYFKSNTSILCLLKKIIRKQFCEILKHTMDFKEINSNQYIIREIYDFAKIHGNIEIIKFIRKWIKY